MQAHRLLPLALAASLALAVGAHAQTPPAAKADSPQNSALNGETFYEILLGELNVQVNEPGTGYALMLDAARKLDDPTLYRRAVEIALQSGQGGGGDAALRAARAWKQAHPKDREANRQVLQLLAALNRVGETLEPLRTELTMTPPAELSQTLVSLPRYYANVTDRKAALAVITQALEPYTVPGATAGAAWSTIGRMRLSNKDAAGALDAVLRGQAGNAKSMGPPMLALEVMLTNGNNDGESFVRDYLAANENPEVRMAYGRVLIGRQRYAEAMTQFDRVTRARSALAEPWLILGSLQFQEERNDEAQASLLKYIALTKDVAPSQSAGAPDRLQTYLMLSQLAQRRKDLAEASRWLDQIDDPSERLSVQVRRASLLAQQGRLDEGLALLRTTTASSPEQARSKMLAEIQLLREAKRWTQAYDLLGAAMKSHPDDADLLYDQAMMAEKLGRLDEMEALLRRVVKLKPDQPQAYNALGYSLAERSERLAEAKELITKALKVAPNDPFIKDSMGWVLFRLGERQDALTVLQEAFRHRPDPEIAAHLGEVLWSLGQFEDARIVWRRGQQSQSDNETLRETLKRLQVQL